MIAYAIKNDTESSDKLILRYKKMFFQTRLANKLKNERYNNRKVSKRKIREKAIVREMYRGLNTKQATL